MKDESDKYTPDETKQALRDMVAERHAKLKQLRGGSDPDFTVTQKVSHVVKSCP